ncbi:neuronal acetylcholine receptor subunit alpha-7-like [Patella vulgata]|uniref:neuronal acetylcholine receptor subunit alpha-7-like n=1 Tax=Patella vulgata TaxID=6465 RepID=UPI00217FCB85|nr:neuronal acetylcholine receptor subunit alpha-7-like [Patella vulgata]
MMSQSIDDLLRLGDYLETRNPKKLRPLKNQSEPLNVYIDFYLLNIIGLDDIQQNLDISVVFNMSWKDDLLSWNEITIKIDRLYYFFLQNVIIPIFMLSFLNLFTFCLPDDSGEKISFSLTVLLSQTVFLSTISESLPTTSLHLVYITMYMNCLLIISCSISIASIRFIVSTITYNEIYKVKF